MSDGRRQELEKQERRDVSHVQILEHDDERQTLRSVCECVRYGIHEREAGSIGRELRWFLGSRAGAQLRKELCEGVPAAFDGVRFSGP